MPAIKTATKKTPSKTAVKKPVKATVKGTKKGDNFGCGVCGLAVTVDESCGCAQVCDIICCGKLMKPKAAKK